MLPLYQVVEADLRDIALLSFPTERYPVIPVQLSFPFGVDFIVYFTSAVVSPVLVTSVYTRYVTPGEPEVELAVNIKFDAPNILIADNAKK